MARVVCEAVSKEDGVASRGKASLEWHDENSNPQYYCFGYKDLRYDEPLETCKKCRDFLGGDDYHKDFEEYQKRIGVK